MADNETRVRYKALADFSALTRSVRRAKQAVKELREEEAKLNAQSVAGQTANTKATDKSAAAHDKLGKVVDSQGGSIRKSTVRFVENSRELRENAKAADAAGTAHTSLDKTLKSVDRTIQQSRRSIIESEQSVARYGVRHRAVAKDLDGTSKAMDRVNNGAGRIHRSFTRLGNWRPRLTPPFIALIPIIAAVLALVNPLVAGFSALGIAAYALGSSLASGLGGAIVGLIPGLALILGLVTALKTAFGGIGSAFKAFSKMKEASGGGGGGRSKQELTDTEKLARAQQKYADATQDVLWAQEDLDEARKGYLTRLRDLQKAVDRIAMSEARAAANSQLARENYANILADPGSTKGMKMDAQVGVSEAQAEYNDLIERNVELVDELDQMKQDGINGDRQVLQSQRALTRAVWAQRDAQLELANEMSGANKAMGGGASAASEYQKMLAKLSPSARKFVEFITSMSDRWTALKRNVQESFFSEVVGDLELIPRLLGPIESMLSNIAGAAGRVLSRFIKMTTSAAWLKDIEEFGRLAAPVIELVGDGLLFLIDAFRNITMAAMPFFTAMSEGFKEGSKNFSIMVDDARKSGALAEWLEKSRQKLAQWWRIIKNIGATLFNYSAAAEDFGGWMLDGFEKITEGWRKASEDARKEGSPFREYLEEIKPLLSEVKGLFADFFGWFGRESMDSQNITGFTDLISSLRKEFGPALGELLNTLSDNNVAQKFVDSITKILEVLNKLFESGGGNAIATFFDTLNALLDFLKFLTSIPGVGWILGTLATGFAAIAAVSFVGKFTGLTKLLGLLIGASRGGGVMALLGRLGALVGVGSLGRAAVTGAVGTRRGPGGGAAGAVAAVGTRRGPGGGAAGAAGKGGNFLTRLGGRAAGGLKGGIGGLIASLVVGTIADEVIKDGAGGARDTGGGLLAGAAGGAGIGALVGSVVPGVGTGIGAAVGGVVGGGVAAATMSPEQWEQTGAEISSWWEEVTQPLYDFGYGLGAWWDENVVQPWRLGITNIQTWWQENVVTPFEAFVAAMGRGWDQFVVQPFTRVIDGIKLLWSQYVAVPFSNAIAVIKSWWSQYVTTPFSNAIAVIKSWWSQYVTTPFSGAIATIQAWWKQYVTDPFTRVINGIKAAWDAFLNFDLSKTLTNFFNGLFGGKKEEKHNGGPIRRAGGGGVPGSGNSDTVNAKLTPGEFVVRKAIVNRVGEDNLVKFNAGVMSYAEMLQAAMREQSGPTKQKQDSGFTFNTGGLVPGMPPGFGGSGSTPPPSDFGNSPGGGGSTVTFGDIIINNPKQEPASDSLPRSIRKATYLAETSR